MINMCAKNIILAFCIYHFFAENVLCQVCVKTKMNWRDVPETFLYTYMEAYEKPDCLFWCTDTRVATARGSRIVRKQVAEQINVCCEGYVQEASYADNSLHCKPVCHPSCINGYCKSPGLCACNPGYIPNVFEENSCVPLCLKGCEHGTCTAPNTCECEPGYENVDELCKPICHEQCENSTCVAPDTCQCLPGYKKSENGVCETYCASYTASGECVITTACEPGWTKVTEGSLEICEPVCTKPCLNGLCVLPDTCECINGYVQTDMGACEPYCSSGCPQGRCIGPDTCACEPGWFMKESGKECLAHCDHGCGNGTCVAPNVCECSLGYVFDESMLLKEHGNPLCVAVCENCEEPCIDLEDCNCSWPLVPIRVTAAGIPCSEWTEKCERIICLEMAADTTTTSNDIIEVSTDLPEPILSTTESVDEESTFSGNDYYELNIDKASWLNSTWFYGIGAVLLILVVIAMLAAILKRKYSRSFESNIICGSDGNTVSPAVHYKQSSML